MQSLNKLNKVSKLLHQLFFLNVSVLHVSWRSLQISLNDLE